LNANIYTNGKEICIDGKILHKKTNHIMLI